jgi:hypothetical protein
LTGIGVPLRHGIELVDMARERYPHLKVLFVSANTVDLLPPEYQPFFIEWPSHLRHLANKVADALAQPEE